MSGGTEGGISPHWLVLERRETAATTEGPSLAIGRARSRKLLPEESAAWRMSTPSPRGARSDDRCGHRRSGACSFRADQVSAAHGRAHRPGGGAGPVDRRADTLKSMGVSRGAAALGVALALGEIGIATLSDDVIGKDASLWSGRASTSAGIELMDNEIVVLGMSDEWSGPLAVDHAVMADNIDIEPVRAALRRLGLGGERAAVARRTRPARRASREGRALDDGRLRGARHTMLDDSDISRHAPRRAFVAGALAGLVGHAEIFVSGGAEHQGPDGGGPVAVITSRRVIRGGRRALRAGLPASWAGSRNCAYFESTDPICVNFPCEMQGQGGFGIPFRRLARRLLRRTP